MLILKETTENKQCEVDIDYYVPFTIRVKAEKPYAPRVCQRIGNFKNSLMEITIDEATGVLREMILVSVNRAYSINTALDDTGMMKNGTPVFWTDGNFKNGLYDEKLDFDVYLSTNFIMVDFSKGKHPIHLIELGRVRFGFDRDGKLVSVIIKNLSSDEYNELKDSLKLERAL